MSKAVILLSGGLDSATVLAIARSRSLECCCLSFDYGQRHRVELDRAKQIAVALGAVEHKIFAIDLRQFGGSALTGDLEVPKDELGAGIPVTYVPARNTIFLSIALAYAETTRAESIWIGVNALDYSGYPDCRPEYIAAFQSMANLATKAVVEGHGVSIEAPLIRMSKAEIIRMGLNLGVDYALTTSCYDPSPEGVPCGRCDSCLLRAKGFTEAGSSDPLLAHR